MCKNCVPDSAGLRMSQRFCDMSHGTSCARGAAWLRHRWSISRGSLCGTSCTRWSATTTRRSAPRPRASAMAKGCLGSSRRNSGRSCAAASWPAVSPVFDVPTVGWIGSCRSRARGGRSARVAALRPFEKLRVAVNLVERRRCSGPSRATSRDGGRLRLIALNDEAAVIGCIQRYLGLPTEIPASHPARAPALDVARAALSSVEGRPSRSRAVPVATAGTRSDSTRAADWRLVWPVCTHEMHASFSDSLRRRSTRSRLHRWPDRRRTPPPPNIRWTMLPQGS
jgi:hypothetical protein